MQILHMRLDGVIGHGRKERWNLMKCNICMSENVVISSFNFICKYIEETVKVTEIYIQSYCLVLAKLEDLCILTRTNAP